MEIRTLPHSDLEASAFNPKGRSSPDNIAKLQKSIHNIGLQYPILVCRINGGNKYQIVDGHRRYASLRALKRTQIPCIVADTENLTELFNDVNRNSKPLSSREWCFVYTAGGDVPKGQTRNNIVALDELLGRDELVALMNDGFTPAIYRVAKSAVAYTRLDTDLDDEAKQNLMRDFIRWMARRKQSGNVYVIVKGKTEDGSRIVDAFRNDSTIEAFGS